MTFELRHVRRPTAFITHLMKNELKMLQRSCKQANICRVSGGRRNNIPEKQAKNISRDFNIQMDGLRLDVKQDAKFSEPEKKNPHVTSMINNSNVNQQHALNDNLILKAIFGQQ